MNRRIYRRASEVLPPELIEQVRERFPSGGYLFFRSRKTARRMARNLEIIRMAREGRAITEIAETFLLSRGTVLYVLRRAAVKNV